MDQSFHTALAREAGHARRCLDMHRIEGFPAALDIKADGVDGTVGAEESRSDRSLVMDISFRRTRPASAWDADPTRSGWRDAARTWNLWSSRCRTIRRPRNPVPPKTVMSPRWPAALCVGSSAIAVSRHATGHDLSRARPHGAERLHPSMPRRPSLSTSIGE